MTALWWLGIVGFFAFNAVSRFWPPAENMALASFFLTMCASVAMLRRNG